MYEKYTQKSGKQIIEKLASNQSDQDILNNIAEQIAEEYIMPQFNAHIANDFDLDSTPPFLHIKRELTSNQSLLSNIMYKPDRTAWNMCSAFGGSGSTFTIKNIYNHIIRTHKEDANKSFLYLNFQEITDSQNILETLIKYHWNNTRFDVNDLYTQLPQSIDEFDVLRKALVVAIKKQFVTHNKHEEPVIVVLDGLEQLIYKDEDFKFWIMFLGGAIQQRMVSVLSVSSNDAALNLIHDIVSKSYGKIGNKLVNKFVEFFSVGEIERILQLNLNGCDAHGIANKIHQITKGYPVLVTDLIKAMQCDALDVQQSDDEAIYEWFEEWYEKKYFGLYVVPALKLFKASSIAKSDVAANAQIVKMIKQIRSMILRQEGMKDKVENILQKSEKKSEIDQGMIDFITRSVEMLDDTNEYQIGVLFPQYICKQKEMKLTQPIIKEYWKRHSADQIAKQLLTLLTIDEKSDASSAHRLIDSLK